MEKYFAAANSEKGFVSWFSDIFDPLMLTYTYVIKGGSGTGKSTVMKNAAEIAKKHGARVEYFMCSADPSSVDGIIMSYPDARQIAMLDGITPHTTDPKYPGVCDEIVNLGSYWCTDLLSSEKEAVIALLAKKKALYDGAYADLAICGTLQRCMVTQAGEMLLYDKLKKAAIRLLTKRMKEKKIKDGACKARIRGLSAISCDGEVTLTSFDKAEAVYLAVDTASSGKYLFDALITVAKELGLSYDRAPSPLIPEHTEALYFPELSMSVVTETGRSDAKPVNMMRFLDSEKLATYDRLRRRMIRRSYGELLSSALDKLAGVKRLHSSVEAIYVRAMDFTQLSEAAERLYTRMGL